MSSTFDLRLPAEAEPAIAMLTAATDGPDDPSRYLVDRMVATLPDGNVKAIARVAAPYVAAYLNARLVEIAPRFVAGLDGIAAGVARIATHLARSKRFRSSPITPTRHRTSGRAGDNEVGKFRRRDREPGLRFFMPLNFQVLRASRLEPTVSGIRTFVRDSDISGRQCCMNSTWRGET